MIRRIIKWIRCVLFLDAATIWCSNNVRCWSWWASKSTKSDRYSKNRHIVCDWHRGLPCHTLLWGVVFVRYEYDRHHGWPWTYRDIVIDAFGILQTHFFRLFFSRISVLFFSSMIMEFAESNDVMGLLLNWHVGSLGPKFESSETDYCPAHRET